LGVGPALGPGGAPVNMGSIMTPQAPSTPQPALVNTAAAASSGVIAASNAAAANTRATTAAAQQQGRDAVAPRAAGTGGRSPREIVDLLWSDPRAVPQVRAVWKKLLEETAPPKPAAKKTDDFGFDDDHDEPAPDAPKEEPPEAKERRDVVAVIA